MTPQPQSRKYYWEDSPPEIPQGAPPTPKYNWDTAPGNTIKAQAPAPAPASKYDWGTPEQSPPTNTGNWLTRSLIDDVAGSDVLENARQKVFDTFKSKLPDSMQGAFLTDFADEVSKAGPGFANFLTSPLGIGLAVAHMVPETAPFAGVADLVLGGQQALQAIPDALSTVADPGNGRKWGRTMVDLLGAYAGLKGGARVGEAMRAIPADTGAGLSLPGKMKAMATAYPAAFRATVPPPPPLSARALDLKSRLDAAAPDDRPDIIRQAEKPTNLKEKIDYAMFRTPVVRGIANVLLPSVQKPPVLELGQYMVDQHIQHIEEIRNHVRREMDWIHKNVPQADQDIQRMGYAMEGDAPNGGPLSQEADQGLEKIRQLNRERDAMMTQAGISPSQLRDPDTYIRHYWDFDTPAGGDPAKRFIATRMMRDPSIQARKIGTLKMGMETGINPDTGDPYNLTPRYRNVTDIVYRRHMEAARAVENQNFANALRDYGLIVDPTKANTRTLSSWGRAVDAPAINRAMYGGKTQAGDVIMRDKAPLVHPDIEMAVNAIFAEPFKGIVPAAINQLSAFSKQLGVGFSVFHLNMISEIAAAQEAGSAGATMAGLKALPRAAKAAAWFLDPEFIKGIRDSYVQVRGKVAPGAPPDVAWSPNLVEPWLKSGGRFQSSESEAAAIDAARNFLAGRSRVVKALGAPVRAFGDIQYIFNHALFDYYLPGQWLHTAEHLYASELNRLGPSASQAQMDGLRAEISDHNNRWFGTENWQHLMVTPKAQAVLRATFFAPTWMVSRMRMLTKGFETTTGARLSGRSLAGAAGMYFLTSQLANYALSSWYGDPKRYPDGGGEYWDEESQQLKRGGHWTWQNPGDPVSMGKLWGAIGEDRYAPGLNSHSADIYFGQNPDGSARYIRQGKYAADAFNMLMSPFETISGKLSLPLRQAMTIATGSEPGSGYQVVKPATEAPPEARTQQRWAAAATMVTPFAAETLVQRLEHWMSPTVFREPGSTSQFLGLPAKRGATFGNSVQALRDALTANRPDLIQQIQRNAALNGVDMKGVERELRRQLLSEQRTAAGVRTTAPPPAPPTGGQ